MELATFVRQAMEYADLSAGRERLALWPCLDDDRDQVSDDVTYFYQDVWAASYIIGLRPACVVDIGSTLLLAGISALLRPTICVDLRRIAVKLGNLYPVQACLTALPFEDNSIEFLASMCVAEHVGLGRYGGMLDQLGSVRAFGELQRVVAPTGHLLFSVPVANKPWVCFNAHRVFTKGQILGWLPDMRLISEAFLFPHPGPESRLATLARNEYGVWCAHMIKETQ